MKSLLYITFSLLVSVAAIYSVARNYIERSDVQLSDLDAPRGTYTYQVDLTTDLGIEKSGVEPMEFSHSEVKGVWRETWAEPIDGVTQVAIYFKSESKLSSNQSAQTESANGKKAFAQVGMDGSLIDFMFAPDVSQKTRALISSLFIYRNFTRGNGQTWEAREFDGLAMISVTYKVKERTIKRLFPEGDSSDPMQGYQHSSITYEINAMGMPDIVQIDINLRRSLNGQFIQSNIHGSMRGVEDYEQLAQRLSTKAESIPAEYQRQKIGSHEPRKPFIIASAKVAHVEVAEIVSQLDRLISSENQPAKNGFFVALSDYLMAHPEDLAGIGSYLLELKVSSPGYQDKATLLLSAMNGLASPEAEAALIDVLTKASAEQEILLFQSSVSLGGHLAPTTRSMDALWRISQRSDVSRETRSAGLMAMGAVAARLPDHGRQDVVGRLKKLTTSARSQDVIMAIGAMENLGLSSNYGLIKRLADASPDSGIRSQAVRAISKIHGDDAVDFLVLKARNDPVFEVRMAAVKALSWQIPSTRAFAKVRDLFDSLVAEASLRQVLLRAMYNLGSTNPIQRTQVITAIQARETDPALRQLAGAFLSSGGS